MSDLVSGLLAKLDGLERLARSATAGPWRYNPGKEWHQPTALAFPPGWRPCGEEFVGAGPLDATVGVAATGPADHPQSMADAAFIAANGPDAVLRLCRAHRDIIDEWRQAQAAADADPVDVSARIGAFSFMIALRVLARGLGVREQSSE